MNLQIFAIHDLKAEAYMTPFFFSTQGQALRAFQDLANDKNSTVGQHPEDYRLFHIGHFNTDDAQITPPDLSGPRLLATATDLLNANAVPLARIG